MTTLGHPYYSNFIEQFMLPFHDQKDLLLTPNHSPHPVRVPQNQGFHGFIDFISHRHNHVCEVVSCHWGQGFHL
jgi:hypothetical protein